jgi:2-octaprenyl-6-methoxyphenol hydroxylase
VRVGLVHAPPPAAVAAAGCRPIALSAASVRILATLRVWPAIASRACAIRTVHVSEQGRFGMVRLRAQDMGVDALGYVVESDVIGRALQAALDADVGVTRLGPAQVRGAQPCGELLAARLDPVSGDPPRSSLLVAADGGESGLGEALGIASQVREYGQRAVVCAVSPGKPHEGIAYERFTPHGPLALLPLPDARCAVVWTLSEARANQLAELPEADFLGALQQAFGRRLGQLHSAGARTSFALSLVRSHALTAPRVALVGNAANRLHPVAGQGLNLGLRDAAALADFVAAAVRAGADPGADAVLAAYARARRADQRAVVRFTDLLARGFRARPGLLGGLRSAGMLALDLVPPASRALARRAMGLGGRQSRLVRGIAP